MGSESSKFPALRNRTPIDGLARRVMGKGEHHHVPLLPTESESPIATWRFDGKREDDLTGRKRGLFVVVGPAAVPSRYRGSGTPPRKQPTNGALWVVRCVCGVYTRRRTKSLKRKGPDACSRCQRKRVEGAV